MLTIRLMRFGRKHQPFFRLVVVPKRGKPKRSKYVESVGWVDPLQHKHAVNAERVKHWLSVGAQPSVTAWNLFIREGIVGGKKRPKGVIDKAEEQREEAQSAVASDATAAASDVAAAKSDLAEETPAAGEAVSAEPQSAEEAAVASEQAAMPEKERERGKTPETGDEKGEPKGKEETGEQETEEGVVEGDEVDKTEKE